MRNRLSVVLVACLVLTGLNVLVWTSPASATTTNSVVWGKSYRHKSYVFHQVPGRPGPLALHSNDGRNDFVVNADGDLSTSRLHRQHGRAGEFWYPYWRAHSDGRGAYFFLQRDGNLIVKRRDRSTIVWKSGKYLTSGRYNFALVIADSGSLTEYYSNGNPLEAAGRRVLWAMSRLVGGRHVCGGGNLQGASSTYTVLLQDGSFDVSVRNLSFTTMSVAVYRAVDGGQLHRRSGEIGPGATRDFGIQWNTGNGFQTASVHVDLTAAGSPSGVTTITGHCWFRA